MANEPAGGAPRPGNWTVGKSCRAHRTRSGEASAKACRPSWEADGTVGGLLHRTQTLSVRLPVAVLVGPCVTSPNCLASRDPTATDESHPACVPSSGPVGRHGRGGRAQYSDTPAKPLAAVSAVPGGHIPARSSAGRDRTVGRPQTADDMSPRRRLSSDCYLAISRCCGSWFAPLQSLA